MTYGNVAPAPLSFNCEQAKLPAPARRITPARNVRNFFIFFSFRLLVEVCDRSARGDVAVNTACLVRLNPDVRHEMDFWDRHVVEGAEEERDAIDYMPVPEVHLMPNIWV